MNDRLINQYSLIIKGVQPPPYLQMKKMGAVIPLLHDMYRLIKVILIILYSLAAGALICKMQNAKCKGEEGKSRFKPFGLNASAKSRFKAPLSAFLPRGGRLYRRGANGDSKAVLWRFRGRPSAHSSLFTLHFSLFTLHSSLFTLHSSLFTFYGSPR